MKDLKYLLAYLAPVFMFLGLFFQGLYTYAVVLFAFVLVPLLDWLLPSNSVKMDGKKQRNRSKKKYFSLLLFFNLPLVYGLLGFFLWQMKFADLRNWEIIGLVLSMGIILATSGINVAHELGHRRNEAAKLTARLLLLPSLYTHFTIEHNRGHHKNVATPKDPATAKRNQSIYNFWFQSVFGSIKSAWKIEKKRLQKQYTAVWGLSNRFLTGVVLQFIYLGVVFSLFGPKILLLTIASAIISFLLLESINYIEHYGLQRNKLDTGMYERPVAKHSWNSNHQFGRIILYELTRHSDHHLMASKKYQVLENHDAAPQLPIGYPGAMLLALIPPVWFKRINPILD